MCQSITKFVVLVLVMLASHTSAAVRRPRLSLATENNNYYYTNIDNHPGTYAFGYDVVDPLTGNTQFRTEELYPNGTVMGSYGFIDPRGQARHYIYVADEKGYRIKNGPTILQPAQPSISWTRPSKSKKEKTAINPNFFTRKEYNKLKPPSAYILD